jgi:hypothetical protein
MMDAVLQQRAGELLRHAALVQSYESKLEEIEGRGFNLFHVLRLSRAETSCHSRLLGDLLDPKGSHGQGDAFLQDFLEVIDLPDFPASGAIVHRELGIGPVTEVSGGRIDLLIRAKTSRGQIAIENKIDAGLGEKQLERYAHYLGDQHLVLLTLRNELPDGVDPERLKREFKDIKFRHISYEIEIRDWLKRCLRRTGDAPSVRESIRQYLHLIDELTDNNPSQAMNEAIAKMILKGDEETYRAYMALVNARGFVEGKVLERFYERLTTTANGLGLEFIEPQGDLNQKTKGFSFASEQLKSLGLIVSFEFDASGYRSALWGFSFLDSKSRSPITDSLKTAFQEEFGECKEAEWWPAWIYWEDYPHWTPEVFAGIVNGSFDTEIETMLQRLLAVFAKACAQQGDPQS